MIKRSTPSTTTPGFLARISAAARSAAPLLAVVYLAIILGLLVMYGPGDFSTPSFIYQGF